MGKLKSIAELETLRERLLSEQDPHQQGSAERLDEAIDIGVGQEQAQQPQKQGHPHQRFCPVEFEVF